LAIERVQLRPCNPCAAESAKFGAPCYTSRRMAQASEAERADWEAEFEAAARRPLAQRFRYAFIRTYKPVLDDAPYRAFDTLAAYRAWCNENLPNWLGYGTDEV
jgi:hypothetical protein